MPLLGGLEGGWRVYGCEMHCHKYKTIDSPVSKVRKGLGVKLLWMHCELNRRGLIQNDCHYGGVVDPAG